MPWLPDHVPPSAQSATDKTVTGVTLTSAEAFQAIAQACLDWCSDTGTCHFCRYHAKSIPHEDWCPVRDYEYALAHGSVTIE